MTPIDVLLRHMDDAWEHRWDSLIPLLREVGEEEAAWQSPIYREEETRAGWPGPGSIFWHVTHLTDCKTTHIGWIRHRGKTGSAPTVVFGPARTFHQQVVQLQAAHLELRELICELRGAELEELRVHNGMTLVEFVTSITRHDVWHAGQIAVAKRLWRNRDA